MIAKRHLFLWVMALLLAAGPACTQVSLMKRTRTLSSVTIPLAPIRGFAVVSGSNFSYGSSTQRAVTVHATIGETISGDVQFGPQPDPKIMAISGFRGALYDGL